MSKRATDAIHAAAPSPLELARLLGLEVDRRARPEGCKVLCPWHTERRASCRITTRDRRLVAYCDACREGGDIFSLVAVVNGLDVRHDFRRVLELAAELVGVTLDPGQLPRAPKHRDPVEEVMIRMDSVADCWLRGGEISPRSYAAQVLEDGAANGLLVKAFDLLVEADIARRERDKVLEEAFELVCDDLERREVA